MCAFFFPLRAFDFGVCAGFKQGFRINCGQGREVVLPRMDP